MTTRKGNTQHSTIVKGKFLWDGLRDAVVPDACVLLRDGRIVASGPEGDITTMPHDEFYDWPGVTLMPGLIDSHTHLSMDATMENYLDHMSDGVAELTLRAFSMMKKDLFAGITTCRCLGDKEFLDIACRQSVTDGSIPGPRVLVATRGIRAPQGHGFVGYPFNGLDEIRKAVRENVQRGADLIKIYITGTLKGTGTLPSYLTREEIALAIHEAHDAGLPIASHCVGGEGLDWALELGLDTLEHAYHITDKQIEKLAASRTKLVLTPSPLLTEERVRHLPQNLIQGHLDERNMIFDRMAAAVASSIPFAVGTDGMHGELVREIEYLVDLGASNHVALKAATSYGAKVCGIESETGTLEPGKRADIIAVKGNPLDDVQVLRRPVAVVKQGEIIFAPDRQPTFTHQGHAL
jgi:imidazolonepropionase-like amidohydrolase